MCPSAWRRYTGLVVRVVSSARPTRRCMCATCLTAGVADGVGGWHAEGLDPSLFAKALLRKCAKLFMSGRVQHPKEILKWAYEEVLWVEAKTYGECPTAFCFMSPSLTNSANMSSCSSCKQRCLVPQQPYVPQCSLYGSVATVSDVGCTVQSTENLLPCGIQ